MALLSKSSPFITLLALSLYCLPGWAADYRVGAASQVITPPLGNLLAGYGRDRAATGVHSDLFARAVVIDDGHSKLALVTLDTIGLTRPDILTIRALAAKSVPGLDASRVVISSTHTHAGPDVVGLWGTSLWSSGRDDAYMKALLTQTVSTISAADKAAVAASSRVASSKVFDVPLDNWGFRLMMWLGVLERESFDGAMRTEAAWFSVGSAEFVTHPGETSPAWSIASRELMSAEHSFVLGLAQDAIGYILKPQYFAEDADFPHAEYLRSVSVGKEAGPRLMATLAELIPDHESVNVHEP